MDWIKRSVLALVVVGCWQGVEGRVLDGDEAADRPTVIDAMDDVTATIHNNTLIVLDLDLPILMPQQSIACPQYLDEERAAFQKRGFSRADAWEEVQPLAIELMRGADFALVDPKMAKAFSHWLERGAQVIGITSMDERMTGPLAHRLREFGLFLTELDEEVRLQEGVCFANGILATGMRLEKGEALSSFLKLQPRLPGRLIYLDSGQEGDLEEDLSDLYLEYWPIVFDAPSTISYDRTLANMQRRYAGMVLPDEIALQLAERGVGGEE